MTGVRRSLTAAMIAAAAQLVAAAELPKDWIDPDTGHRVIRLSVEDGTQSPYFVEISHRSATACHVGTIAYRLGRKVRWDPKTERFPGDREAQAMMTKSYRAPWALPAV